MSGLLKFEFYSRNHPLYSGNFAIKDEFLGVFDPPVQNNFEPRSRCLFSFYLLTVGNTGFHIPFFRGGSFHTFTHSNKVGDRPVVHGTAAPSHEEGEALCEGAAVATRNGKL